MKNINDRMSRLRNKFLWSQLLAGAFLALLLRTLPVGAYQHTARDVVATIFVFYLPGYRLSLWFFKIGELSVFERTIMSGAISLAVVSFVTLYMFTRGYEITTMQFFIGDWVIILCSFIGLMFVKQ